MEDKTAWEVIYNDGSVFRQYEEDGKENVFRDINQEKMVVFNLYHNGKYISLNIKNGSFFLNGLYYKTDISELDKNYRLIYFARKRKVLGGEGDTNTYFVGYQVTIEEKNHKRMVSLCNNEISFINE